MKRRVVNVLTRPRVTTHRNGMREWDIEDATVTSSVGLIDACLSAELVRVRTVYRGRPVVGWAYVAVAPHVGRKGFRFVGNGPLVPVRERATP